jgi:hypothetical protein
MARKPVHSFEEREECGGYILTRPRARRLDNILCGLPND